MNNIIKVPDFIISNMKNLLEDYFLYVGYESNETVAHSLELSSNIKELHLTNIINFFVEVAMKNDSYVMCYDLDNICNKLPKNEKLIYGREIPTFKEFHKLSVCIIPHWPRNHEYTQIMNKIFDSKSSMFIVVF